MALLVCGLFQLCFVGGMPNSPKDSAQIVLVEMSQSKSYPTIDTYESNYVEEPFRKRKHSRYHKREKPKYLYKPHNFRQTTSTPNSYE